MNGSDLQTLGTELNGGAAIGTTLYFQFVNVYRAALEQLRPWVVLRKTDTSKTVTTGNTWQTAIDLSTITDFSRFYGDYPIRLFDGNDTIEYYRRIPTEERLLYKDTPNTFVYDEGSKTLYLGGTVPFAGTLWIRYLRNISNLSAASEATAWPFPSWSHAILAFGAVAMHKGGVDYDEVNARQLVYNNADAKRILDALETLDDELQRSQSEQYDPHTPHAGGFRANHINL